MTHEQAIEALQLRGRLEISGDAARLAEFMEGLSVALDVLRTLTTNRVLTLEQLRQMNDLPVYVVPTNHDPDGTGWCVVHIGDCDEKSYAEIPGIEYWAWPLDTYGEKWTAYAYLLEHETTQPAPEFAERAEKELQKAANDLEQAARRGAPQSDIFNLQRKVEYKQYVLGLLKGR